MDKPEDGLAWLAANGDPYRLSIVDRDGRVGIDFGMYGVPETFVIDKSGVIRYKQIGPINHRPTFTYRYARSVANDRIQLVQNPAYVLHILSHDYEP